MKYGAGVASAALALAVSSCTIDGESPLSYRRDCREAIDAAASEIERSTGMTEPSYEDFPAQFVESLNECPRPVVWLEGAMDRLRMDTAEADDLQERACALVEDARSCPADAA